VHPPTGDLVLYPCKVQNRRLERRKSIIEDLKTRLNTNNVVDMTHHENDSLFLESTGSFILDRVNRVAFLCVSERSSESLFLEFCKGQGYEPIVFHAVDSNGKPYYHANVILSIGSEICFVCMEAIEEKEVVRAALSKHGIIEISRAQVDAYCGNMLELGVNESKYLFMSSSAKRAFSEKDLAIIKTYGVEVVDVEIPTIQSVGGGGVRCMIAEIGF
jgi:hypothetical protein